MHARLCHCFSAFPFCLEHPTNVAVTHTESRTVTHTFAPKASPEITAAVTPPWLGLGIYELLSYWYCGSTILSLLDRFTHNCKPATGSSDVVISAWPTPLSCSHPLIDRGAYFKHCKDK